MDRDEPTMTADRSGDAGRLSSLTSSQMLIWAGQRLQPGEPLYNMVLTFDIRGPLDAEAFGRAFQALVAGCDALRAYFVSRDDVPQQSFRAHDESPMGLVDFSVEADPSARLADWLSDHSRRCFDLEGRLYESALLKLGPEHHVWYLNQHHLTMDAWSVSVLFRRMHELYGLAREGRLDEAAAPPRFQDYLSQEREQRGSPSYREAEAYWSAKLETPFLPSRFYRAVPADRSGRTERVRCDLGAGRSARLRARAEETDFRAFSKDLAFFQIFAATLFAYLHRITGHRDLAIGTPSHNRNTPELKDCAGLFIEVLPFQIQLAEAETFRSLHEKVVRESQQFLLSAQAGSSGFELGRCYDVVLNYITAAFGDFDGHPTRTEWLHPGYGDRNHLLRLQVHDFDRSDSFTLHFDVNVDAFVGEERDWLVGHFLRLLDAFLEDPDRQVAAVPLLADHERRQLTVDYNDRGGPGGPPECVVELFEAQAARTPERTAIACGEICLDYRELNARANRLARVLADRGVEPGVPVAIAMTRSVEAVVAILGVLKSGGAYLPIDPSYPAERISYLLSDAEAPLVLTQTTRRDRLPVTAAEIICLDQEVPEGPAESMANPRRVAGADDTAYIIYTSGSTGRPKGVVVGRGSLGNYLSWAKRYYLGGRSLDLPLFSSLSFDLTVTSTFLPLISGGTLVVYEEPGDAREVTIQRVIEDNKVDLVKLTPSHLALVEALDVSASRIKGFIVGGEDLKTDLARRIVRRFGGKVEIYNEYGPTEATVGCMIHRYDPEADGEASVPIGRAIDNAAVYIVDELGNPVPRGVTGEIFIAGRGVARGYLKQEDLTSARFVETPFRPGERMYRTGDLARWNPSGQMAFLGRADDQVKIRGVRVELGEIEAALLDHAAISDCVVALVEGRETLAAEHTFCVDCGLSARHPDAHLDSGGVCRICRVYATERDAAQAYFRSLDDLRELSARIKAESGGEHDCVMLLSGGKDSTYALCQLVDLGLTPLVFTLDNGYISEGAKANIQRVVEDLGLELVVGTTAAMDEIFRDSLARHSNVCNGCFKTIYTMSMNLARQRGIRYIVTGLSRGQIFETRLADLLKQGLTDPERIDRTIVEARKAYHRLDDAVSRSLDVSIFQDDAIFDEVQFIDFYRYCDVTLDVVLDYLGRQVPWIRPLDTGRSTNCLINKVGIHVHQQERGYHNYALPYSWDVRLGHKTRDAAREELDDKTDVEEVAEILARIGYGMDGLAPAESGESALVAYYLSTSEPAAGELKTYLGQRLPADLVPGHFLRLDQLPLTPNGKVDRQALPRPSEPRAEPVAAYAAPTNRVERELAAVWSEVLGIARIGIDDDFFDLGGDSILCVQIVAKAKRRGIATTPQQIFDHPTVARLATVAAGVGLSETAQEAVEGPVILTPIQRRFFAEDRPAPDHFNLAVLLEVSGDLEVPRLEAALRHLLRHHDGLRSRFERRAEGWCQVIAPPGEAPPSVVRVDLSAVPAKDQDAAIDRAAAGLHRDLDLGRGQLVRAAYFARGAVGPPLVLLVSHHLVVDGVSWWILLDDLETAYEQLRKAEAVRLPAKTTSLPAWSRALSAYARSRPLLDEVAYWSNAAGAGAALPKDRQDAGVNDQASARTVSVALSAAETERLLHEVPGAYRTQVPEVLVTALAQALCAWSDGDVLRLDIEHHGREEIAEGVDLLRSVGWFTTIYPVTLRLDPAADPGQNLQSAKQQLRDVPNRGIGYGVLRYLSDDAAIVRQLAALPRAEVLFNYLGQWDRALAGSSHFRFARPIIGSLDGRGLRSHALEINAFVLDGRLQVDWSYSESLHRDSSVRRCAEQFAAALRALIDHCLSARDPGHTPADFPHADLDQGALDELLADFGESAR